ncbi:MULTISPECIES: carbohydrate ABC transporter permease [Microbacterium]|uniref:Sugar ABC transporter permease n=1 Tax=Microbacterium hominis TaxID=162426 RepID=A0A134DE99_9MICO|nr:MULTISPECIES: sugar ABC transporter permease [Microbacterium]AUG30554.1 sugar ABC transporter permease [Microbacterium hominis]KXC04877.1 ABC transporter permease [Microbacterium hominis]QOC26317.1 sugar ABC transporter permease [Microbacterium hominis]QOC30262.1 sugar ABC transporter permease [Microbacterium hominis]QYF97378.1 sugar ABC transporter permease [Microbacterium sp. PAMC21962]
MSLTTRSRRTPVVDDEPAIPQRGGGRGGYWLYLLPGFVLLLVIVIVPLVWNVYLTFTSWKGVRAPEFIGVDNWIKLVGDDAFWTSFLNSVWMVIAMVIVPTIVGLIVAALLFDVVGRKFGGRVGSFLRATYYLPQILPVAVAGIVIGWIVRPGADGALNQLLAAVGIAPVDWLGQMPSALIVLMVVLVWVQIGYPVVVFMAALQRVDPELYEAAELDGANWFQRFASITVSIIRPEIFVVTLTCTIAALKVFGPVYVITRGGPAGATLVPSYYAYQEFFTKRDVGYGATIATVLTIVVVIVSIVFIRVQNSLERKERAGL